MEKLANYQYVIKKILNEYIGTMPPDSDEEVYLVEDPKNMNYLIYQNVWRNNSRIYGCILHIRIKNEKIYVEYDGTDQGFGDVFADAGIPKNEIVLAFHSPAKRPYTAFAVA